MTDPVPMRKLSDLVNPHKATTKPKSQNPPTKKKPKTPPRNPESTFTAYAHPLSEAVMQTLKECLGYPDLDLMQETLSHQHPGMKLASREPGAPLLLMRDPEWNPKKKKTDVGTALLSVGQCLGFYIHGAKHIDNVPRRSDYRNTFQPIADDALKLVKSLMGLGEYYRDQLKLHEADFYKIHGALLSLADSSLRIVQTYQEPPKGSSSESDKRSSRGKQASNARSQALSWLLKIYADNSCIPKKNRSQKGGIESLSEYEKQRLRFIRTSLNAVADATKDKFAETPADDKKLLALIRAKIKAQKTT